MKRLVIILAALLLSACSGFKLGGLAYCPFGAACSYRMLSGPAAEEPAAVPAAPAASGVSV